LALTNAQRHIAEGRAGGDDGVDLTCQPAVREPEVDEARRRRLDGRQRLAATDAGGEHLRDIERLLLCRARQAQRQVRGVVAVLGPRRPLDDDLGHNDLRQIAGRHRLRCRLFNQRRQLVANHARSTQKRAPDHLDAP
jgi:hypothetical protein